MFLKVVIYQNVAFTRSNTQKDITELRQTQFAWEWAFKHNLYSSPGVFRLDIFLVLQGI